MWIWVGITAVAMPGVPNSRPAALPLLADAAHGSLSALTFQVENVVKTKN